MIDDVKQLKEIMVKGFKENKEEHKELDKLLFKGNGKPSLVSRVTTNEANVINLSKVVQEANAEILTFVRSVQIYMQETSDFVKASKEDIKEIKDDIDDVKEDTKTNSDHRTTIDAQLGVWKWLAKFLGLSNIAVMIYAIFEFIINK